MRYLLTLLFLISAAAQPPDPLLWGSLQPGSHPVGFRSSIELDPSRQYDGPYPAAARHPRPILVDIWYPASPNSQPRLHYRDYFALPPSSAPAFTTRLARFAQETARTDIFESHKSPDPTAAFNRFLSTTVYASQTPAPAEGRFPLVLYHSGAAGSYEDNTALFEYLASHGYVVISSAYQSWDSSSIGNNHGAFTKSIRDLGFLIAYATALPFADTQHIAAIGHSAGAQAILQWLGEPDCPADAAVSLDTTIEYSGLDAPIRANIKKIYDDNESQPAVPVLLFASTQFHPKFDTWDDYLQFAPRYFASIDNLTHNDYLMHGALYGSPEIRRGYDRVCTLTLQFLDATLKQDRAARNALRRQPDVRYKAAIQAPPTARQLADLIEKDGIAKWLKELKGAPKVYFSTVVAQAAALLAEDNHPAEAQALQKARDLY